MARWEIKNVRIAGVAAAVPRNVVYTTDFDFFTLEEAEVFNNTVGIKQRHIAPEDVCASDLCFAAAEQLLADLKWERESVDVLIFESVTAEQAAVSYNYTWPLVMLACLGVAALIIGIILKRVDKVKGLGLELPNVQQ